MWNFLVIIGLFVMMNHALGTNNLNIKFEWKQLEFAFPSEASKNYSIMHGHYIPENNLPLGLEIYKDKLFITIPRWKSGVAASLTYIDINDAEKSPKLHPYPNWPAHNVGKNSTPEIVSPFRIRADQCDRLWVLDTGTADLLGDTKILAPNRITVYNLKNDTLLRQFVIPRDQLKDESFLGNIAVEVVNCEETYAYLADLGKGALIVYSWKTNSSWKITHNFFDVDPLAGDFNVSGIVFNWTDAIFGIALSPPNDKGFSTLFFHPLVSNNEFSVSTEFLRDPEIAKNSYHQFNLLGSRGPKGQSTASFFHPQSNVLFYGLINLNAVDCWRTTKPYTKENQGRVYQNDETCIFPNDLKVDNNNNLWVLTDRLPKFMYQSLDPMDVNFRILTASVSDAVKGTACDVQESSSSSGIMDRFRPPMTNNLQAESTTRGNENKSKASTANLMIWLLFSSVFVLASNVF